MEFHIGIAAGLEVSTELNCALVDVERAMLSDRQYGAHAFTGLTTGRNLCKIVGHNIL